MKSYFVSNVSHELRTPLTAIKGSADNMLDGLTGELNDKQAQYLRRIQSNTERLTGLINNLLDRSVIESGKMELRADFIELTRLVHETADTIKPVADQKNIHLEITASDDSVVVWADRDKVTQVLMNLVGNAIKFTLPLGEVNIAVTKNHGAWAHVAVSDTGPGIPPDEANKIFDEFYQATQPDAPKTRGTGLGLSISRSLVQMHGGRIWVTSEVGRGSTFYFTLPMRSVET